MLLYRREFSFGRIFARSCRRSVVLSFGRVEGEGLNERTSTASGDKTRAGSLVSRHGSNPNSGNVTQRDC